MLRPYQIDLASKTLAALQSHDRVVMVSPTGSGKTHIAIHGIIPNLPKPVMWLTHRVELAEQAASYGGDFQVAMIGAGSPEGFASVIIDEGHHACAKTYRSILRKAGGAKVIAMTATPYRLDGQGMGSVGFTHIVYGEDIFSLTNDGHLCPCEIFIPKSEKVHSWSIKSAAKQIAKTKFTSGIVYCRRVSEAKFLVATLCKLGIEAKCLSAKTQPEDRHGILQDFRAGRVKVICNHTILTEGTDLPQVDLIVLNRPTKSRALWRQMIGRGLRNAEGKEFCTVLDLASNSAIHGSIYDKEVFDLLGRVVATEPRYIETKEETQTEIKKYKYNNGEELKQWKPIPELKIMRRTLLTLNAQLLKRKLLTATSAM